ARNFAARYFASVFVCDLVINFGCAVCAETRNAHLSFGQIFFAHVLALKLDGFARRFGLDGNAYDFNSRRAFQWSVIGRLDAVLVAERNVLFLQHLPDVRRLRFDDASFAVNQNRHAFVGGTGVKKKGEEDYKGKKGNEGNGTRACIALGFNHASIVARPTMVEKTRHLAFGIVHCSLYNRDTLPQEIVFDGDVSSDALEFERIAGSPKR